jgi:hypothetical protein
MTDVYVGGGCDSDQLRRIVDPDDVRAALDDLVRQRSIAAADIKDALADLRIEKVERRGAQLRDKAADARIVRGVPATGRGDGRAQSVFTQSR